MTNQIKESDVAYLEDVEHTSFTPIGWLYASILESLLRRGLVAYTMGGAYIISDYGAEQLAKWRATHR